MIRRALRPSEPYAELAAFFATLGVLLFVGTLPASTAFLAALAWYWLMVRVDEWRRR